jgi:flavodoxin
MKNSFLFLFLFVFLLVCTGCSSAPAQAPSEASQTEAPASVEADTLPPSIEAESTPQPEPEEGVSKEEEHSTVLVVYFSATGTTRGVAERIASLTGADLAEIVPAQPYTAEDLSYNDRTTRATVEQNTPDARPEIANEISLDGYTTVYLGYPIWWGQAPRIMSSFVESHDFTGVTVIPFCTSGSSGAGRTGETLGEQAGTGVFLSSTRLSAGISDSDLQDWIDSRN